MDRQQPRQHGATAVPGVTDRVRRTLVGLAVAVLAATGLAVIGAPAAHADGCASYYCTNPGGGATVRISVIFTGDAAGGGAGGGGTSDSVYVKPVCYWYPVLTYGKTLQQVIDEYYSPPGKSRGGANDYGWPNPPLEWWAPYLAAEAAGHSTRIYEPTCDDGNSYSGGDLTRLADYATPTSPYGLVLTTPNNVPPPQIDPFVLVEADQKHLQLGDPQVDHNPEIGALGGGTLVGLPTYFWMRDGLTVGGAAGTRTIRATAAGVWAQINLQNDGITLVSDGFAPAACSHQQALTRYGDGGTPCSVVFTHASIAAPYTVTAASAWKAAYQTSDGQAGPVAIDPVVGTANTITVGESQAIVQGG